MSMQVDYKFELGELIEHNMAELGFGVIVGLNLSSLKPFARIFWLQKDCNIKDYYLYAFQSYEQKP